MTVGTFFFLFFLFLVALPILGGISLLILSFNSSSRKIAIFLLCMACILLNMGFLLTVPTNGLDLERYFNTIHEMSALPTFRSLINFWQVNLQYERTNLLFTLIEWLVSRTQYFTLLPFITTILCSFFIMYPFLDLSQRYKDERKIILFFAFISFFLVGYGWMASTSRWGLAVTSAVFVDYIYFVNIKKKRFSFILLLPILFHIGSIVEVILALYAVFIKKTNFLKLILVSIPIWCYLRYSSNQSYSSQLSSTYSVYSQLNTMTNVYSTGVGTLNFNGSVTMIILYCTVLLLVFMVLRDICVNKKSNMEKSPAAIILLFQINCLLILMLVGKSDILNRFVVFPAIFGLLYESINIKKVSIKKWGGFMLSFLGALVYEIIMIKQFQFVFSPVQLLVSNLITIFHSIQVY